MESRKRKAKKNVTTKKGWSVQNSRIDIEELEKRVKRNVQTQRPDTTKETLDYDAVQTKSRENFDTSNLQFHKQMEETIENDKEKNFKHDKRRENTE